MSDTTQPMLAGTAHRYDQWLDLHFECMRPEYEDALRWVGLQRGWHVLDAGCGGGSYLPLLCELVGRNGRVSACDSEASYIERVQRLIAQDEWDAPVEARIGNLLNLPYPDAHFDAVWCANVLQYLSDAGLATALAELRRVTKPSGLVAVKDFDGQGLMIQTLDSNIVREFYDAASAGGNRDIAGWLRTGQLGRWMRLAGLQDVAQRHIPMVRTPPLRGVERKMFEAVFKSWAQELRMAHASEATQVKFDHIANASAPDAIVSSPDFVWREIQIVFVGRV